MKLVFAGLENAVEIAPGVPAVLQIENSVLFSRVCQSLLSGEGRAAAEPYTVWEGEEEIDFSPSSLFVSSPLELPWDDRAIVGGLTKRLEKGFLADEDLRGRIEQIASSLSKAILELGADFSSDIGFNIEWDYRRYAKTFGFGVLRISQESVFDNLIEFLSAALDAGCQKVLVFINLKTFLSKNELERLYEHVFFCKSKLLLVENKRDIVAHRQERKYVVDQHFLEY